MSSTFNRPLTLPVMLRFLQCRNFPHKLGVCDRLFGRRLATHGICWVRTAPGAVWKLDLTNHTHRWIVYGDYEGPAFWRWLHPRRHEIHTIVDSGANIGQTVIHFSALAPAARILAYEPGATARQWLAEGVAANGFMQVSVEPAGLGAMAGEARLEDEGRPNYHGSWNRVNATTGETIKLVTLDDELARCGIATVDVWKLDMEGSEFDALRGAARSIESGRIRVIYVEAAGESGRQILSYLTARGYRVHHITPAGRLAAWKPNNAFENALCLARGEFADAR